MEIDPRDVGAWIDKATATFFLSTGANNRYDEAIGYLKHAAQLAPTNSRIHAVRDQVTLGQALWHQNMANLQLQQAFNIKKIWIQSNPARAAKESRVPLIASMNHLLAAAQYAPDSLTILGNIRAIAELDTEFSRSPLVTEKVKLFWTLTNKKEAEASLGHLRESLTQCRRDLDSALANRGFFSGSKISNLQAKVQSIQDEITLKESQAAVETPRVRFDW